MKCNKCDKIINEGSVVCTNCATKEDNVVEKATKKSNKKTILIFVLIILISIIGVTSIVLLQKNGNKKTEMPKPIINNNDNDNPQSKENDGIEEPKDEEKDASNYSYIIDTSKMKVLYPIINKEKCQIDNDGHLKGLCKSQELENQKFIFLTHYYQDAGEGAVYALTDDGKVYIIEYVTEDNVVKEPIVTLESDIIFNEKIDKIGYIETGFYCSYQQALVYLIGGKEFIAPGKELNEESTNLAIHKIGPCGGINPIADSLIYYDKHMTLPDGKSVKDSDTKKDIIVKYSIYKYGEDEDQETEYVISQDDKLYIMNDSQEYYKSTATVKNITKKEVKENNRTFNEYTILLNNGEKLVFNN